MSLTKDLIEFIVALDYDDLNSAAVDATRKIVIDTTAAALAGSAAAGVRPVYELTKAWGGAPESSVLVYGNRLPVFQSAFLNSMMAHALDFDDIHATVAVHASCSVVPTALAMSECLKGVGGRDFVTAVVLGIEIASRLGMTIIEQERGWHLSAVCGALANAAVAGKLMRLGGDEMRHALGIAYSQSSGTLQSLIDGTLTKRMQPGFAAKSGVVSAFLAKSGLTGPDGFLEGTYGFFKLYFSGRCRPDALTQGLGRDFEVNHIGSKPYPCCRLAHTAIDATLDLLAENEFSLDEVSAIDVEGSAAMHTMCGKPYQVSASSEIDAQFSLQYLLILTLLKGRIAIDDFSPAAVRDPAIIRHTAKVSVGISPDIHNRWGTNVVVKTTDGRTLSKRVDIPRGQPENPMSWDEYVDKFKTCSSYAAKPLRPENIDLFIQHVQSLERMDDVATLTGLIS